MYSYTKVHLDMISFVRC